MPARELAPAATRSGDVRSVHVPARLVGIDILRAFAASAVVVAHVLKWRWGYATAGGIGGAVWSFFNSGMGTWGVGIFFILSGLCVHLPMARAISKGNPIRLDLGRYLKRRGRRIYPPHFVALVLSWAVAAWVTLPPIYSSYLSVPTPGQLVAHLFMAHTFVPGAYFSISSVLWTIALEAHFYLLYPLLLWARRRIKMSVLCGLLFAVMVALQLLNHVLPAVWRGVLTYNFLGRWWEWVLGAVLAEWLTIAPRPYVSRSLAYGAIALSAVAACYVAGIPHGILIATIFGPLGYAAVICVAARVVSRQGSVLDRALVGVGFRSYSLYLTHPIALTLVAALLWRRVSNPAAVTVLAFGSSYLLMAIYFLLVERRFLVSKVAADDAPTKITKADGAA